MLLIMIMFAGGKTTGMKAKTLSEKIYPKNLFQKKLIRKYYPNGRFCKRQIRKMIFVWI